MSSVITKVHLLSGFLGVGKTTLLRALIAQKPADEKWALIVNEFGEIGIDGAVLSGEGLPMAEVAGGCLCCVAGPQMTATVAMLLRRERPDRLLIEASGLAHAASVIDELRTPPLSNALEIGAVLTVVDVRQFTDSDYFRQPLYRDQVSIADVLVATKGDLADAEQVDAFERQAGQLFPPKSLVVNATNGRVDVNWLDAPLAAKSRYRPHVALPDAGDWQSCGWSLPAERRFNTERIAEFFSKLPTLADGLVRAKGVFFIEGYWVWLNWVDGSWGANMVAWRRDNRFELIARSVDEAAVEAALYHCMEEDDA